MASSIDQVMKSFSLCKSVRPSALHTDGQVIYSYALPLLYRQHRSITEPETVGVTYWFMAEKPSISVTTSKHYNQLKKSLLDNGLVPATDESGNPIYASQSASDAFNRRGFNHRYQQYRKIGE